ncbi:MAG TPA: hypothetical protein PLJ65_06890 [Casimicrobium sp.]|nr:hypothetical protein [Casimicrobium sp.]
MKYIKAQVTRYVDDEPQPGIVECCFVDAFGRTHVFVEKTAIVSGSDLTAASEYPVPCGLACEVEREWRDEFGAVRLRVCTERPWGLESLDSEIRFVVDASQMFEDDSTHFHD